MEFILEIVSNRMSDQFIKQLFNLLKERAKTNDETSYTSQLTKNPELLAKKLGEETSELIIDFIKQNKKGIINESADLLYHILVIWISAGVDPQEIWDELYNRQSQSGIEEKKNRKKNYEKKIR
jgi:phosphoribosyl-ATP pyrophosphohydrolase